MKGAEGLWTTIEVTLGDSLTALTPSRVSSRSKDVMVVIESS
ncbi:MAG: hypothetical protein WBL67_03670 [Nitrososphaeraceae archaeon]